MLYEQGLPIGMGARVVIEKGFEVSWLHVADELQKNGWPKEAIISRLREETADSAITCDMDGITSFVNAEYEEQREMIFRYLYGNAETALIWGRQNIDWSSDASA